jgi:hypothetical protein
MDVCESHFPIYRLIGKVPVMPQRLIEGYKRGGFGILSSVTAWDDLRWTSHYVEKGGLKGTCRMVDFVRQTTTNYVRFYPISPAAKKYVENGHGDYKKYYKPEENCTVFELPGDEGNAEYYASRLVEGGFHVQEIEPR